MTTDDILFGVGLTFALAVGCQVIASLVRVPALILLLPAGFIAGTLTDDIHPDRLLGPAFQPLVSLAVALILYDAGVGLDPRKVRAGMHRVVIRLIALGVACPGPRPRCSRCPCSACPDLRRWCSGRSWSSPDHLPGYARVEHRPISETLVQLIIGLLFVSISATVTPASLHHVVLPTLAVIAVLVLVTRPVAAGLATLGTNVPGGERAFIAWMAPRGIVAAASATTFSQGLVKADVSGASNILPVTFMVIAMTVALYGLTAVPVGRRLGVTTTEADEHRAEESN